MKHLGNLCAMLALCGLFFYFLGAAGPVRQAARKALALCAQSVIPSMLPFLVVSDLLISLGLGNLLGRHFAGLMALYHLPGSAATALFLGLLGGCPIGAKTTAALFRTGALTESEARRLLPFVNNAGPVFLISVLGVGIFQSLRVGVWLWLIHLLSALLTGLCFRGRSCPQRRDSPVCFAAPSLVSAVAGALTRSGGAMLSICVCVVFFSVLVSPLTKLPGPIGAFLTGLLELFSMTPHLTADRLSLVIASLCTGWGGLSVLCQTAAILEGTGLPFLPCLKGKAVQGLIAGLLALALAPWILPGP